MPGTGTWLKRTPSSLLALICDEIGTRNPLAVSAALETTNSRVSRLDPMFLRMRHLRLWLLVIGVLSLVAEAVAAAAVFWRANTQARDIGPLR